MGLPPYHETTCKHAFDLTFTCRFHGIHGIHGIHGFSVIDWMHGIHGIHAVHAIHEFHGICMWRSDWTHVYKLFHDLVVKPCVWQSRNMLVALRKHLDNMPWAVYKLFKCVSRTLGEQLEQTRIRLHEHSIIPLECLNNAFVRPQSCLNKSRTIYNNASEVPCDCLIMPQ